MFTFSVDDEKHAFSSEGLISKNTASEVLKIAKKNIWTKVLPMFWESGVYVQPVLSVHDELILEAHKSVAEEVQAAVIYEMEHAVNICVPVISEGHISKCGADGGSWADLK
jgi:DNA polymerase-1